MECCPTREGQMGATQLCVPRYIITRCRLFIQNKLILPSVPSYLIVWQLR